MSDLHLDDEQLSAALDGEVDVGAHVSSCAVCSARFAQLGAARDAVAAAVVRPLTPSVLDSVVAAALAAEEAPSIDTIDTTDATDADAAVVPLTRRRPRTPPPAWLIGAAAALLLLVGVTGLFRAADDGGDDDSGSLALTADEESDRGRDDAAAVQPSAAGAGSGESATEDAASGTLVGGDPAAVAFDLADQSDPAELGVLLRDRIVVASAYAAAAESAARSTAPAASGSAPTTSAAVDTARCRSAAEAAGGEALGPLLATGTVRWKGQPAEVLVFALRSPTGDVTRQAMVLQRPGCALLAEQRF